MLKKNSNEYKLRKQKRIKKLNSEIDYMKKEIARNAVYCFFSVLFVVGGIFQLNLYLALPISLIITIFVSLRNYKNWTAGYEEELDHLFEDENLYFGCDAFYNDSGDDNGNWI